MLEDRGRRVLSESGVSESSVLSIGAATGRNAKVSGCTIIFASKVELELAAAKIRARRIIIHGDESAWLVTQRGLEQQKAIQMVRVAYDIVVEHLRSVGHTRNPEKIIGRRSLCMCGVVIGYSIAGTWKWTPYAAQWVEPGSQGCLDTYIQAAC